MTTCGSTYNDDADEKNNSDKSPAADVRANRRSYAYGIVRKARWDHLGTSHHIKPEPLGEGLMWLRVLRLAHLAVLNDAVIF